MMVLLRACSPDLALAPLVAVSSDPVLLVSELVAGSPLTFRGAAAVGAHGQEVIGAEIGRWLAVLHSAEVLAAVENAGLDDREPTPQADTDAIRTRFVSLAPPRWAKAIHSWCEWVDGTLMEAPRHRCVLHGDLHGHNQIWDPSLTTLRAVVDFEESAVGDPAYDFRYLPAQAPELVLLHAAVAEYMKRTGTTVDLRTVMAWHIRTVLGDALWRTEAGVALPDGGTIVAWLEQLSNRIRAAGGT